jgi:plasmid stabilization system protein ParE
MRRLVRRSQAERDILEQSEYIADNDHEIADKFLDAVEETISILIDMPETGSLKNFKNLKFQKLKIDPSTNVSS